jgi:ABC-type transport system involved in multi-copper enzyme maturation permease subunit
MSSPVTAAGRDTSRPLPFFPSARGVYGLALEGMIWSRRSLLMAILLGLPVAFALLYRGVLIARMPARITGFDLYAVIIAIYYVRNVLPLAALFYATSLIADEVEGKTLTYLLTRPLRRPSILAGKFAAYLTTTLTLTLPATVITFFLLATARGFAGFGALVPELFRDLGVMALSLLAYGAFFTLLGVLLRRPMIPGLLFLFIWEMIANLPGYLPRFTLTAWLRSLLHHRPAEEGLSGLFQQVLPAGESLAVLLGASLVFLALSFWIFNQREYVMDQ